MAFIIRKIKRKDIKKIQDIAVETWHATYDGIIPRHVQDNFLRIAYSDTMMSRRVKQTPVFVAVSDKEVVGFAQYTLPDEQGKTVLTAIYIYPEHQGKGIGTAFLDEAIQHLSNVKEIHLNVEKDNRIGRSFYAAKGFEFVTEFEEDFGGHTLNTIKMKLILKA